MIKVIDVLIDFLLMGLFLFFLEVGRTFGKPIAYFFSGYSLAVLMLKAFAQIFSTRIVGLIKKKTMIQVEVITSEKTHINTTADLMRKSRFN